MHACERFARDNIEYYSTFQQKFIIIGMIVALLTLSILYLYGKFQNYFLANILDCNIA